jgi:hypothetical protein
MLARRLTTILPAMRLAEALETTRIHRVAGLTGARTAMRFCWSTAQTPPHDVTHDRRPRLMKVLARSSTFARVVASRRASMRVLVCDSGDCGSGDAFTGIPRL